MKHIYHTLILLFLALITEAQNGRTNEKHSIDIRLEKCLARSSNQATYGMINCEDLASAEWDKELNKYYQLLMEVLPTEEKNKLRSAQLAWVSYKEKEKDFSATMHYNMQGTMWKVVSAGRNTDITRQRTLELISYYNTYSGE